MIVLSSVTGAPLPLLGGALCLDFVNTIDPRLRPPQEDFLATFAGLIEWGHYVGELSAADERSLLTRGARDPSFAAGLHARALKQRKALYRLFRPGGTRPATTLKVLNDELACAAANRALVGEGSAYRFEWRPGTAHERLLGAIALSAADLLTSPAVALIHECAGDGCGWLFLDTSKARRRRWCSMAICGNRAKAQRHRQRARTARDGTRVVRGPQTFEQRHAEGSGRHRGDSDIEFANVT